MDIEIKKWEVLYLEEKIKDKLRELGVIIEKDYKDKNFMVVFLLKGSFIFCVDLVRNINLLFRVNFMIIFSYGNNEESIGKVKVVLDVIIDIVGYDVLVVDDIIDFVFIMDFVLKYLKVKNFVSLKCCVFLDKLSRRKVDLVLDYCGFEIEDKFVVGYGFDFGDYYRNVFYIFNVIDEDR